MLFTLNFDEKKSYLVDGFFVWFNGNSIVVYFLSHPVDW